MPEQQYLGQRRALALSRCMVAALMTLALSLIPLPAAKAAKQVVLILTKSPVSLPAYPLATGVPIPRGELFSPGNARLVDSSGAELPIQAGWLATWPDGSIKSLLVQYLSPLSDTALQWYVLEYGADVTPSVSVPNPLQVTETASEITVNTGPIEFVVGKRPFRLFDAVRVSRGAGYEPMLSGGITPGTPRVSLWTWAFLTRRPDTAIGRRASARARRT